MKKVFFCIFIGTRKSFVFVPYVFWTKSQYGSSAGLITCCLVYSTCSNYIKAQVHITMTVYAMASWEVHIHHRSLLGFFGPSSLFFFWPNTEPFFDSE